jgi:hypothetical protein
MAGNLYLCSARHHVSDGNSAQVSYTSPGPRGANPDMNRLQILFQRWVENQWLSLVTVLAIGLVLRTVFLTTLPDGYFRDEAWTAIKARAILDGRDPVVPYFAENDGVDPANAYMVALLFLLTGPVAAGSRIITSAAASLTLLATYWVASELFADDRRRHVLALTATFVLATLFWALTTSRSTWMVMLMALTATVSVAALWRGRRLKRARWFIVAGISAGLCQYTYLGARVLVILLAVMGTIDLWTRRSQWRTVLAHYLWFAIAAMVVFAPLGWFFIQNSEMLIHHAGQVAVLDAPSLTANILKTLAAFSIHGDDNVLHNLPGRPALDPILSILFIVGLAVCVARRRSAHTILLAWIVIFSVPMAFSELTPMFRRWVGILPAEAILIAVGAVTLAQIMRDRAPANRLRTIGPTATATLLILSAGISIATYFGPYASHPDLFYAYDVGITQAARYIATQRDKTIFLTPYDKFYEVVDITLAEAHHSPIQSYNGVACQVFPAVTQRETEWVVITEKDGETLPLIQQLFPAARQVWQLDSPRGVYARALRVPANQTAQLAIEQRHYANLGGKAQLLGFDYKSSIRTGKTLSVTVALQDITPLDQYYKVFVHLVGANDVVLAQDDRLPCSFTLNKADWQPGNIVLEEYHIPIPPDMSRGEYDIALGMYQMDSNVRLPVIESELEHTADSVTLGKIVLK